MSSPSPRPKAMKIYPKSPDKGLNYRKNDIMAMLSKNSSTYYHISKNNLEYLYIFFAPVGDKEFDKWFRGPNNTLTNDFEIEQCQVPAEVFERAARLLSNAESNRTGEPIYHGYFFESNSEVLLQIAVLTQKIEEMKSLRVQVLQRERRLKTRIKDIQTKLESTIDPHWPQIIANVSALIQKCEHLQQQLDPNSPDYLNSIDALGDLMVIMRRVFIKLKELVEPEE
ncbi:hypothetical protein FRC11_010276 [Ceratobasidium sp. 423]|nr:hypothetical protein FRC11_010276 [Ceratobasidium sp. 423]